MNESEKYTDSGILLFLLGPMYLVLIRISGVYSPYNSKIGRPKDDGMQRKLVLMSLGTIFYVILFIVLISYDVW